MPTTIESLLTRAHEAWDDPRALSRLGRELEDRNRLDAARRTLRRTLALDPHDVLAWIYLSYAEFRSFHAPEGLEVLRRGVRDTGADVLRAALAGFAEASEADPLRAALADTVDPGARAQVLSQRFHLGEVPTLEALRDLARRHPDDPVVVDAFLWTLLGARQRGTVPGLDLRTEGVPQADRLVAASPESVRGWSMKVSMLQAEKDWPAVLAATAQALERMPDEETLMQQRGRALRETGDDDRAAQWFLRAIGAKPSFVGARVDLGKTYEAKGRFDLAEEVFREMPRASPDYPLAPVSLALYLARREAWEEAERLVVEAWPRIPEFFRPGLLANPAAAALWARPAVRAVVGGPGPVPA